MRISVPKQWNVFAHGKPGHRFQDRYRAHQRDKHHQGLLRRLLRMILAMLAAAVGVVLMFIPGPAIVFFFLAGALLASDWLWMARLLDWSEVKLRSLGRRATQIWRGMSFGTRAAVIAAAGCLSVLTTYSAYRLMH